jgi:hypothetical protein
MRRAGSPGVMSGQSTKNRSTEDGTQTGGAMNDTRNAILDRQCQMLDAVAACGYLAGQCLVGDEWRYAALEETARARLVKSGGVTPHVSLLGNLRRTVGAAFLSIGYRLSGTSEASMTAAPR